MEPGMIPNRYGLILSNPEENLLFCPAQNRGIPEGKHKSIAIHFQILDTHFLQGYSEKGLRLEREAFTQI